MLGNYTCSALTGRGSADHTVLVSTENILFPLTAPSHVRSRQGWAANCSNTLDRKYGTIVLLRSHQAQSHSKIQQRQQFSFLLMELFTANTFQALGLSLGVR